MTLAMMIAIAFGSHPDQVLDHPQILVMPIAVVLCVGILSIALMQSDQQHRDEAVIDPLTSMLNRKSLKPRAAEIGAQSAVSGAPVGLVVVDIDHFKRVNDSLGHATGDAVLRDVAYTIRKGLRAFELAYRLGGEEFLMLLPGANRAMTRKIAESVRTRIAAAEYPEGLEVTVSCGFSASEPGEPFDYDEHYERADQYLYEAKSKGRNRSEGPAEPLAAVSSASA
jgi:diguanylate cyclase (GGDEF)-like protein